MGLGATSARTGFVSLKTFLMLLIAKKVDEDSTRHLERISQEIFPVNVIDLHCVAAFHSPLEEDLHQSIHSSEDPGTPKSSWL